MTRSVRLLTSLFALGLACAALPAAAVKSAAAKPLTRMPGEIIVKYRDDVGVVERDAQMLRIGAEPIARFGRGRNALLRIAHDGDVEAAIARLKASGVVEYAHPNFVHRKLALCTTLVVPKVCANDPFFDQQFHLHNPFTAGAAPSDADMDMPEAWDLLTTANGVLLAIIDDGFDIGHVDLDANLRDGLTCNQANANCNGNAAFQNAGESHGTAVSGSAAAIGNNAIGVTGMMFSGDVLPLRMPNYTTAEVIMSVDEAIAQGARIMNMSFGGAGFTQAEFDAIDRARTAGILIVAAAGNEDSNTDKAQASYPANYAIDNLIAVAASDAVDGIAGFSTWGSFSVDLAAAGDQVYTTDVNDAYHRVNGTSFSSPITAGAAALIGQHLINNGNTTWTYQELKARLFAGADNESDTGEMGLRGRVAAGRVNVRKSLDPIAGGVLVVQGLTFDDNTGIAAGNDGDAQPDPGELLDIVVTIENAWQAAGTVAATLSTTDTDATVTIANDTFPSTAAFGTSSAEFRVQLGSFTGNEQIRFRLDLTPQVGAVQTRYFYLEVGALQNGVELTQQFQRTNWDEFHAWHATVPPGSTNVVFETHSDGGTDIDLIARRVNPPAYFAVLATSISTGGGTGEACDISDPCIISGEADGEELIGDPSKPSTDITGTQPGTWHLVVVNFDQTNHFYRVKASWDAGGAGTVRFANGATAVTEASGNAVLQVVRSGGVGAVSVDYSVGGGSAGALDFTASTGTLSWANGDMTPRTITVPILSDTVAENAEEFYVGLSNAIGGADIGRYGVNTVTIAASSGSGGGGGGGGATDVLLLAGLLASLLAARRRRLR